MDFGKLPEMISKNDERIVSRIFEKRLQKLGYWFEHTEEKPESVCHVGFY